MCAHTHNIHTLSHIIIILYYIHTLFSHIIMSYIHTHFLSLKHTFTHSLSHTHTLILSNTLIHTVLDQQLPQFRALEDMKTRANGSLDFYLSHAIKKPSRRKLINTHPTSLTGSSIKVKAKEELCSLKQPVAGCALPRSRDNTGREIGFTVKQSTRESRLPQLSQR